MYRNLAVNNKEEYRIRVLGVHDIRKIQQLCDSCSDYYHLERNSSASLFEGHQIIHQLPQHKDFYDKYVLGVFDQRMELVSIVDLVTNYPNKKEWMLNLMLVAPQSRGKGLGRLVHQSILDWGKDIGARSLHVSVVKQNKKGLNFWNKLGYKKNRECISVINCNRNELVYMSQKI